jgi:hypothetical protein
MDALTPISNLLLGSLGLAFYLLVPAAALGFFAGAFTTLLLRAESRPGTDTLLGVAGFLGAYIVIFLAPFPPAVRMQAGPLFVLPFVATAILPALAAVLRRSNV